MKIVVRGANWIGDSLMTVPALRALRSIFPQDQIFLHTREWAEGIFRDADFLDGIIPYKRPASAYSEVVSQSAALRKERFDLAILFPNSFASALTVRLAGVPRRIGYANRERSLLLTDRIPLPNWRSDRHEVFFYQELIKEVERRVLGTSTFDNSVPCAEITVSAERKADALAFLSSKNVDVEGPLVVLGPGSTNSIAKRWPLEKFAEVADKLKQQRNASVLLLGGKDDAEIAAKIVDIAANSVIDLVGKTALPETAEILSVCDLLISNDMGLAHLAPAVGTKTLVIFGPTNPVTTRPFSDIAEVVREGVECSPCMLRECPIDHRCMNWISADRVVELAVSKIVTNDEAN